MKGKYLILGSNLGTREIYLDAARKKIIQFIGPISRSSSIYESEPWGYHDQPPFLNQVIQVETSLDAFKLLDIILSIETTVGRQGYGKWRERIIDIDIIYYDSMIITSEKLTLPHPGIADRRFMLVPLCEMIPEEFHPVYKITHLDLLKRTNDTLRVEKMTIQYPQTP